MSSSILIYLFHFELHKSEPQRSTEEAPTATENIMHKKKKRISFADEAGGVLCHVKYFKSYKTDTGVTC